MRKYIKSFVIILIGIIGILFMVSCSKDSGNSGTYYLYENDDYDKSDYIILEKNTWKDDDNETGEYTISGDSITFYGELLGSKEELYSGKISDGVMEIKIFSVTFYYCKEGKKPTSSGTDKPNPPITKEEVNITYDANGGMFEDNKTTKVEKATKDSLLTAPTSPTRTNYNFSGWATDKKGKEMWQFSTEKVTSDMTLYAVWSQESAAILSIDGASITGTEIYMLVNSNVDSVSLSDKVVCSQDSIWKLYYDKLGQMEIPTKIAAGSLGSLQSGNNLFYVVVTSSDNTQTKVYKLNIHRSYSVKINYYHKNTIIDTETVNSGYEKEITKNPTITGYTFNYWKDKDNKKITTITPYESINLYADTTANEYTITYDVHGGNELTTTNQKVTYDSSYTLTIPKRTGYTFEGWFYNGEALTDETGKSIKNYNHGNITVQAKWSANIYKVTLNQNDVEAGTVNGGGDKAYDSKVTITATLNQGYNFIGWYDEKDTLISKELKYTFDMKFDVKYTAKYTYYTITTTSNDRNAGSITSYTDKKISVGQKVTLTATFNQGYTFMGWYDEKDTLITTEITYEFTMEEKNVSFNAKYTYYTVTATSNDKNAGSITSYTDKKISVGQKVTITATLNQGYNFTGWYDEKDTLITTDLTYEFIMEEKNVSLNAKYTYYTVTTTSNDKNAGSITSYTDKKISVGQKVTITATLNQGYNFMGWYDENDTLITKELTYEFTMEEENVSLNAKYTYYTVTTTSNDKNAGSITSYTDKEISVGQKVTITATLNQGYNFTGWYDENDTLITTDLTYEFTMEEKSASLNAKYEMKEEMKSFTFTSTSTTCTITSVKDKAITEVIIPNYVTSIGEFAFHNCSNLTSIIIGNSVTNIGSSAFYYCSKLSSVYYEGSIEDWCKICFTDFTSSPMYFANHFYLRSNNKKWEEVTSIEIPNEVTEIGTYQFHSFNNVTSITIPNSVESIGKYAFYNCSNLTSIEIPNSVMSIGESAFYIYDCSSLTSITLPFVGASLNGTSDTHFGYIFGASSYSDNSDYVPSSLKEVIITGGESIGSNAFSDCNKLTSITIPNSVTSIGSKAFYNCSNLTSIVIPNSVTSIGSNAFYECYRLVEIYNLSNLTITKGSTGNGYVGYYAKVIHTSLEESILIEKDNYIFVKDDENKYYLVSYQGTETDLVLPNDIEGNEYEINQYAFYNCSNLTSIEIPNNVTSIGENAFLGCDDMQYNKYDFVYYLGNKDNSYLCLIRSYSSYSTHEINGNTKLIADFAFAGCINLTSITIPYSVTSIGSKAFYNCSNLTSITIGNSVKSIGKKAFVGCSKLTSITIGNSVTSIGEDAFYNCSNLTSIVIPNSVTSIGSYAFWECSLRRGVYYKGISSEWNNMSIYSGNAVLTSATRYYYSETKPTTSGNYWHYVDGVVTKWN